MNARAVATLGLLAAGACARPAPAPVPAPAPPVEVIVAPRADTAVPPAPRAPRQSVVRLAFTGDINLGTATLEGGVPPDSGRAFLAAARPHLTGNLVVGNFEGALADTGTPQKCLIRHPPPRRRDPPRRPPRWIADTLELRTNCYAFRTPTHLAPRLREAGFTHMNLANNHAGDMGAHGRTTTEATLDSLGLTAYGPLGRIAIDTLREGDSVTVVGLIGFTTYPFAYSLLDIDRSAAVVDSVQRLVDLVVVTFHGGAEGAHAVRTLDGPEYLGDEPRGDLRRWARAVIDAGADAVVGHGPHVLRGIEFYAGKPIAYSLGNFATYRGFNLRGPLGVTGVLQLELGGDGAYAGGRLVPMVQRPGQGPRPDPAKAALDLVRDVSIADFGSAAARIDTAGRILPP
jgi:hypothetical protein